MMNDSQIIEPGSSQANSHREPETLAEAEAAADDALAVASDSDADVDMDADSENHGRSSGKEASRTHQRPVQQETLDHASHEAKMFMSTLHQIEQTGNVELMAALFADEASLWRQAFSEPHQGLAGARRFWKEYLDQFEAIHSRFIQVTESQGLFLLEWESQGQLKGGRPIHYTGVSIVQLDAERKIHSFKTYFDSANFLLAQNTPHHMM